jgi:hypothetical protein
MALRIGNDRPQLQATKLATNQRVVCALIYLRKHGKPKTLDD